MATWHQKRNPVKLYHKTKWTIVTDSPNGMMSLVRCDSQAQADELLGNFKKNQPNRSHYILNPAKVTA